MKKKCLWVGKPNFPHFCHLRSRSVIYTLRQQKNHILHRGDLKADTKPNKE